MKLSPYDFFAANPHMSPFGYEGGLNGGEAVTDYNLKTGKSAGDDMGAYRDWLMTQVPSSFIDKFKNAPEGQIRVGDDGMFDVPDKYLGSNMSKGFFDWGDLIGPGLLIGGPFAGMVSGLGAGAGGLGALEEAAALTGSGGAVGGAVGTGATAGSSFLDQIRNFLQNPQSFQGGGDGLVSPDQSWGVNPQGGNGLPAGADEFGNFDMGSGVTGTSGFTGGAAGGAAAAGLTQPMIESILGKFGPQIGGSIIQGLISSSAAGKASSQQANAANNATAAQLGIFNTQNAQQGPYRQAGYTALNDILGGYGHPGTGVGSPSTIAPGYFAHQFDANDLKTNLAPNYQFQLDQGLNAVKNAGNLQTGLVSGNTMKGVNDYAQNFAGNAYQQAFNNYTANQSNIFNRLSTVAGLGSAANQQSAGLAGSIAPGVASTISNAGAANAAGTVGSANAVTGGLNNALGWYSLNSFMNPNG